MGSFFSAIWTFHKRVLGLVGSTILVFVGIGLCGLAMALQFEPLHSTAIDAGIFACGILLVTFRVVRHFVWDVIFLSVPWVLLVAGGVYLLVNDFYRFRITPELIALAVLPPVLLAVVIEFLPKTAEEIQEEASEPHLEITLDAPLIDEPLINDETHLRD